MLLDKINWCGFIIHNITIKTNSGGSSCTPKKRNAYFSKGLKSRRKSEWLLLVITTIDASPCKRKCHMAKTKKHRPLCYVAVLIHYLKWWLHHQWWQSICAKKKKKGVPLSLYYIVQQRCSLRELIFSGAMFPISTIIMEDPKLSFLHFTQIKKMREQIDVSQSPFLLVEKGTIEWEFLR